MENIVSFGIPKADDIIHCGDFTDLETELEVLDFLEWFCYPISIRYSRSETTIPVFGGANIDGLDGNVQISEISPNVCIFGHVHPMHGTVTQSGTQFVNASLLTEDGSLNLPILVPFLV